MLTASSLPLAQRGTVAKLRVANFSDRRDVMSIIEFQLSTPAFLAAQRNALRSLQICRPAPSPEGVLLDKIEFGNNTIRHNVDESFSVFFDSLTSDRPGEDVGGYQTQIAQDVT